MHQRVVAYEIQTRKHQYQQRTARVVFYSHYDQDQERGNPRSGWAYALTIRDLGSIMHEPASGSSTELIEIWQQDWSGLGSDDLAASSISDSIDQARSDVLLVLAELN